ncbi:toxin glutamine deamidase domain-containing protein [Streptomyces acidicola]|uniref:toxin glutamine deamidase domain-containing protein n=1 Tax=Streptomyces acidicola TaxID=2596892 RepID=UPI00380B66FB
MTAVPIHTVATTPGSSTPPSQAAPATPQPPGSPQADPGNPDHHQQPHQDSLDDIRADLDHYPGGLTEPDPADQQALVDAVPHNEDGTPERFPDPFGSWSQLQNDGGIAVPGRSNNCADCSRSFLETWYGNPQVSAARTPDYDENGNHDPFTPEDNANDNQIRWTGAAHTYAGPGGDPETANNIASALQQAGHGSAAIVQVDWPNNGGGHAFNVVNHNGNIIWIDTQSGEVSNQPLHIDNAEHVWHIPLDADRNPIDTSQSGAEDSKSQNDEPQNQNDDEAKPENSENNGQPENNQNPQHGVSGDDTDTGTSSPKPVTSAAPDASHNPGPANESKNPSEPDSTPDGREPSQDSSESRQPHLAETQSPPDRQSRQDEATLPDDQGRTPDKASEQQTANESPARPDSPSEHRQPPGNTTPDNADQVSRDKSTTPTRSETDTPPQRDQTDPGHVDEPRSQTPDTDRRAPAEPAGPQPYDSSSDPWADDGDGTDDGTQQTAPPESSSPYEETQPSDHQHYGMLGDQAQRDLRDRVVHQIDQEPVYRYLENLANNNNKKLRQLLEGSRNGTTWRRDDLMALPGFDGLSRGQQLAAVAVLARLSIDFHANQGVGASPHRREGDNSAYKWGEDEERQALRKRDIVRQTDYDGVDKENSSRAAKVRSKSDFSNVEGSGSSSSSPTQRTRHHLDETYGKTVADQVVAATSNMKPDFSGRNYAVIEVFDPHSGEVHYVADASFNYAGPRPAHSEPHIGGWIERLNEDRAAKGQAPFDVWHMYTEREPCGHPSESSGHADCSGYITHYMPEYMPISYGTGYRKGEQDTPFSDPQNRKGVNTARQAMEADAQHHLNRVADVLKAYALPTPTSSS